MSELVIRVLALLMMMGCAQPQPVAPAPVRVGGEIGQLRVELEVYGACLDACPRLTTDDCVALCDSIVAVGGAYYAKRKP